MKEAIVFAIATVLSAPPVSKPIKVSEPVAIKDIYERTFESLTKEAADNVQVITYIRLPTDWEKVK